MLDRYFWRNLLKGAASVSLLTREVNAREMLAEVRVLAKARQIAEDVAIEDYFFERFLGQLLYTGYLALLLTALVAGAIYGWERIDLLAILTIILLTGFTVRNLEIFTGHQNNC